MSAPVEVEFKYSESRLAAALGLSRGDLKMVRDEHLRESVDWEKNGGGPASEILLSEGGVERCLGALGGWPVPFDLSVCLMSTETSEKKAGADFNGASEEATNGHSEPESRLAGGTGAGVQEGALEAAPQVQPPEQKKAVVAALPFNPMMVLADDEDGKRLLVYVGKNGNFVVGDKIDIAPHPSQPGIWRFLGVLPRDRRRVGGRAV